MIRNIKDGKRTIANSITSLTERKPNRQWELNTQPLDHEMCDLPLRYNRCLPLIFYLDLIEKRLAEMGIEAKTSRCRPDSDNRSSTAFDEAFISLAYSLDML